MNVNCCYIIVQITSGTAMRRKYGSYDDQCWLCHIILKELKDGCVNGCQRIQKSEVNNMEFSY